MLAEELVNKPFADIDYTNRDEFMKLLYCSALANNPDRMTYEQFDRVMSNEKVAASLIKTFEAECKIMAQFKGVEQEAADTLEVETDGKSGRLSSIVPLLVDGCGLSVEYVLYRMELNEIAAYVKYYEAKKREQMEASRLWTYLTVLPHVDGSKLKSATDLLPFPWEVEKVKTNAAEALAAGEDELNKFLAGELNIPIPNN